MRDRTLSILDHMGIPDNAEGIIFGEFTGIDFFEGYNSNFQGEHFDCVADMVNKLYLTDRQIPVAYGFPAGHGDVNYPLLMGETASLKVEDASFTLSWE